MAEVSGAGPAEKREKEESPMNWGHSYWSRFELFAAVLTLVWALTRFGFECKVTAAETDETSNNAKTSVTFSLICVESLPPRMSVLWVLFHYKLYGNTKFLRINLKL